jgi:hypothetical protein
MSLRQELDLDSAEMLDRIHQTFLLDSSENRMTLKQSRSYWVQVFSVETWNEFIHAGASTTGFRVSRWGHLQKVKQGDYLLCYLSRVSRWVGLLEVQSDAYLDNTTRIWRGEVYPCRLDVRLLKSLPAERAVPIRELADRLSIFERPRWNFYLIGSPTKWKEEDANVIIEAINRAVASS